MMRQGLLLGAALWLAATFARAEAVAHGGTLVRLNDFGSDDIAYFAIPTHAPRGGVVVVHDALGLVDAVKDKVDKLAAAGYVAVAPDLFNGQTAPDLVRADDLRLELDRTSARQTIAAAVSFLRDSPRFRADHVALAGWGMGAELAFETGTDSQHSIVEGIATIGGALPTDKEALKRLTVPLLCVTDSAETTPEARAQFEGLVKDLHKTAELFLLPSDKTGLQKEALVWPKLQAFLNEAFSPHPRVGFFHSEWNRIFPSKPAAPAPAIPIPQRALPSG